MGNWYNIWLYGSNSATDFNDVSDINVSGNMILLSTFTYSGSWSPSMGYILLTTSYSLDVIFYYLIIMEVIVILLIFLYILFKYWYCRINGNY